MSRIGEEWVSPPTLRKSTPVSANARADEHPVEPSTMMENSLDFNLIDMDMLSKTLYINLDELPEQQPTETTKQ